ncbi:MAG: recombinase family protein [Clostridia bacterium]|nr:recombinase family protein [Clostridia bacterium]
MYCAYLRKSRLDIEAERYSNTDTLDRQMKILIDFAGRNNISISKFYKEVVSGESIDARPEVQKLLNDVEDGIWDGVLVVEVERLARGDTIDQGIVSRAFKQNGTKIITPIKTYDPSNEFDEEYFEFGLFMSRREYKVITRRIQRGRVQSAKEGKFLSSIPPYGYDKVKIKDAKGYTLAPNKDEAPIVKLIFEMYNKGQGMTAIANELDRMGIAPRYREHWSKSTINDMLKNPVYIGKLRWSYKKEIKGKDNRVHRTKNTDYLLVNGLHPAIISKDEFYRAQETRRTNTHKSVKKSFQLQNPLSGIIYCKKCGFPMTRIGGKTAFISCSNNKCKTVSAPINLVENAIITTVAEWFKTIEINIKEDFGDSLACKINKNINSKLKKEIKSIKKQIAKTFDLLEQGIYDSSTFFSRKTQLEIKKTKAEEKLIMLNTPSKEVTAKNSSPQKKTLIDVYLSIEDITVRNTILKTVLKSVTYSKTERNTKGNGNNPNFELEIFPLLFSEYQI